MDLPYPENFDQYPPERQEKFRRIREYVENGGLLAGNFCGLVPKEILDAAGIPSVSLNGPTADTIASSAMPAGCCDLIHSSSGFWENRLCAYQFYGQLICFTDSCPGRLALSRRMSEHKRIFVLKLPKDVSFEGAVREFSIELQRFVSFLENCFGVRITEEKLREACRKRNRLREAKDGLFALQRKMPALVRNQDLFPLLREADFSLDIEKAADDLFEHAAVLKRKAVACPEGKRYLVSGCPAAGFSAGTLDLMESGNDRVVCADNCMGYMSGNVILNPDAEDILKEIAGAYINMGCPLMRCMDREERIARLAKEFRVDEIVDISLHGCDRFAESQEDVKRAADRLGLPFSAVRTGYTRK